MVGEKPNNPLEAFLLLGKNVRGIAATQLVQQVTEAPNIFVFGELLQLDGVKEVCLFNCRELIGVNSTIQLFDFLGISYFWNFAFRCISLNFKTNRQYRI